MVVVTADGGWTDVVFVTGRIRAAGRYRALLVGEQNYASTVDEVRAGSILSVQRPAQPAGNGVVRRRALRRHPRCSTPPRDGVIAAIRERRSTTPPRATLSLIYITCHGFYRAGMTFFRHGGRLGAVGGGTGARAARHPRRGRAARRLLRQRRTDRRGGHGGRPARRHHFRVSGARSVRRAYPAAATTSVASALLDQDSYRLRFGDGDEEDMATVFARALCDGAGWSIDRGAQSAMNADADYDGEITLGELKNYMGAARVVVSRPRRRTMPRPCAPIPKATTA